MSLLPDLVAFALRPILAGFGGAVDNEVVEAAVTGPAAIGGQVVGYLMNRFRDSSQDLPNALKRASDRAWRSLEIALAGESWWSRLRDRGDEKAFRDQVRQFLDASPLPALQDESFRNLCLEQLKLARKRGLVPGDNFDPQATAECTAQFARFGNGAELVNAEWEAMHRMALRAEQEGLHSLAQLLRLRPAGADAAPLLALSVRFFFRREVATNKELFQGIVYEQVDQLHGTMVHGFNSLADGLRIIDRGLNRLAVDITEILQGIGAVRNDLLDIRDEMKKQSGTQDSLYMEVIRLGHKLDNLHERQLQPRDSLSIRNDHERALVRTLVARYRAMPEDQRAKLPALLDAIGRLEMAAGDYAGAQVEFQALAKMPVDLLTQATGYYQAFLAALEKRDWPSALTAYREAYRISSDHYSLFPQDRYEPETILGAGGFGIVFLCRHRFAKSRIVIKALRAEEIDRNLEDVFAEARALDELDHPAIIRLRDCGFADRHETRPYLMMDYFEAAPLEDVVKQGGALPAEEVRQMARQLAEGMLAAHERNILHRDLKPGNVLVRKTPSGWQLKIIDFGLAMRPQVVHATMSNADAMSQTMLGSSIAGTLDYAAPEQMGKLAGHKVSFASDIFGFGKTLCFALFKTPTPTPRHYKSLKDDVLMELIADCIEEEPTARIRSFKAVLEKLASVSETVPVTPTPTPTPTPTMTPVLDLSIPVVQQSTQKQVEKKTDKQPEKQPEKKPQENQPEKKQVIPILSLDDPVWRPAAETTPTLTPSTEVPDVPSQWEPALEPAGDTPFVPDPGLAQDLRDCEAAANRDRGWEYIRGKANEFWFMWKEAAQRGSFAGQFLYGWCCQLGAGAPEDVQEAIRMYKLAAEQGFAPAMNNLGDLYYHGTKVPRDDAEAIRWYRMAVQRGNASAANTLGVMYQNGRGLPKNDQEAATLYRQSAEKGHVLGRYNLAVMLRDGNGVGQNHAEAARWFRLAADQGDMDAQANLGWMYREGLGVPQDYRESVRWYKMSADQGLAYALDSLGWMYQNGLGVQQDFTEAARLYRQAAEKGDGNAMNNLGRCYHNGWGVARDYAEAAKWYRQGGDKGNAFALNNLGTLYRNGLGVKQDYAEAMRLFKQAADKGNLSAMDNVGALYQNGQGVAKDDKEASRWFRMAAEKGHANGQNNLGRCYQYGWGTPQDLPEAAKWYRKSAEQGNVYGQYNLALLYRDGRGVQKDYSECFKWFKLAAEQGDEDAMANLGWLYREGHGVPKDYKQALSWYQKSAEKDCAYAMDSLGWMYQEGLGVTKDPNEAFKWFKKAAEKGSANAQNNLGRCYQNGWGTPQNMAESAKWYQKSAEQGNVSAQYNLAMLYRDGKGVPKDHAIAAKWFRKAAEAGDEDAMANLGWMHREGLGVPKDYVEAVKWYRKAAEKNNAYAMDSLGWMYQEGLGVQKDHTEALRWYKLAAERGNANAQNNLGRFYENGWGTAVNFVEAARWYRQSAEKGNVYAQYNLGRLYERGNGVEKDLEQAKHWYRLAANQGDTDAQAALKRIESAGGGMWNKFFG
jgi:TPR repeat protein/serine/threonine protein kinase